MVTACGNLVTVDRETGTVYFIHKSVSLFVEANLTSSLFSSHSMQISEDTVAHALLTYLSFPEFHASDEVDDWPTKHEEKNIFGRAIERLGNVSSRVLSQAGLQSLLQSSLKPLLPAMIQTSQSYQPELILKAVKPEPIYNVSGIHSYARSYWAIHAKTFDPKFLTTAQRESLHQLMLEKVLHFPFRPWDGERLLRHQPIANNSIRLFNWTVRQNHVPFLRLMFDYEDGKKLRKAFLSLDDMDSIVAFVYTHCDSRFIDVFSGLYSTLLGKEPRITDNHVLHAAAQDSPLAVMAYFEHRSLLSNSSQVTEIDVLAIQRVVKSFVDTNDHDSMVNLVKGSFNQISMKTKAQIQCSIARCTASAHQWSGEELVSALMKDGLEGQADSFCLDLVCRLKYSVAETIWRKSWRKSWNFQSGKE